MAQLEEQGPRSPRSLGDWLVVPPTLGRGPRDLVPIRIVRILIMQDSAASLGLRVPLCAVQPQLLVLPARVPESQPWPSARQSVRFICQTKPPRPSFRPLWIPRWLPGAPRPPLLYVQHSGPRQPHRTRVPDNRPPGKAWTVAVEGFLGCLLRLRLVHPRTPPTTNHKPQSCFSSTLVLALLALERPPSIPSIHNNHRRLHLHLGLKSARPQVSSLNPSPSTYICCCRACKLPPTVMSSRMVSFF